MYMNKNPYSNFSQIQTTVQCVNGDMKPILNRTHTLVRVFLTLCRQAVTLTTLFTSWYVWTAKLFAYQALLLKATMFEEK